MRSFWRMVNIIFQPRKTWLEIKSEQIPAKHLFVTYAAIMAVIPALAGFVKMSIIGTALLGLHFRSPVASGLVHACVYYVSSLAGLIAVTFVVYLVAPSFGSRKDLDSAAKLTVFSITPAWVGQILLLVPHIGFIWYFIALYSFVLAYCGLSLMMDTPDNQVLMYFLVIIVVSFVVFPLSFIIPNLFIPALPVL